MMQKRKFKRLARAERDRLADIAGTTVRTSFTVPEIALGAARRAAVAAGTTLAAIICATITAIADDVPIGRDMISLSLQSDEHSAIDPFEAIERARAHT